MTISPIDMGSVQQTQSPRHHAHAAMAAAAQLLDMQPSDIRSALESGQSLTDLAKSKGISQDDLVKAMATALQKENPSLSATQATQLATQIATRVPQAGAASGATSAQPTAAVGHHHHRHGGGDVMSALSQLLGESTSEIGSALQGGQSLTDLAESKGVSQDDLVKTLATALQKSSPNLTSDLATEFATALANASTASGLFVSVQA